eukprot:2228026-Alexandrium_andersonii.AAC.1
MIVHRRELRAQGVLHLLQLEDVADAGDDGGALGHAQAAEAEQEVRLDVIGHGSRAAELAKLVELPPPPNDVGLHGLAARTVDRLGVEDLLE